LNTVSIVILGVLAMLLMALSVIMFVILYQRRVIQSQIEIEKINQEKQQEMLNASIQSEEQERMRIAAELHDDIAPTLASIKLYLSTAIAEEHAPNKTDLIHQSKELLDDSLQKIRGIAHKLQPSTLYYLGLQVSLQALSDMFNNSGGIQVQYHSNQALPRFKENIELSLYRITQELVNNIIKHANAKSITINTLLQQSNIILQITHNGTGITQQMYDELMYKKGAIGLKNIVTRLKSIYATIHFEQVSVNLFTINIQAPILSDF
jgi:two-component system, NarL family, sensor kinase